MLFTGDFVMNNSFVAAGTAATMKGWLSGFDRLDALKPATIVPAHGAVGTGAVISANRAFHAGNQHTSAPADSRQGRTVEEVAKMVTTELTTKHPGWPRANGIANAARAAFNEAP